MLTLKYLLESVGFGLLAASAALLILDYRSGAADPRWRMAARLAALALIPLLMGISIVVVPAGMAGVRVSQVSGTMPGTLYPGLHLVFPLVQGVALYDMRDQLFQTTLGEKAAEALKVQTREGLSVGLAVAVRYRIDPRRLDFIHTNLPQPVDKELVPPVVAQLFPRDRAQLPGARPVRLAPRGDPPGSVGGHHAQTRARRHRCEGGHAARYRAAGRVCQRTGRRAAEGAGKRPPLRRSRGQAEAGADRGVGSPGRKGPRR